jgi:hypothetical protein
MPIAKALQNVTVADLTERRRVDLSTLDERLSGTP